jgi:hypothetical protein
MVRNNQLHKKYRNEKRTGIATLQYCNTAILYTSYKLTVEQKINMQPD